MNKVREWRSGIEVRGRGWTPGGCPCVLVDHVLSQRRHGAAPPLFMLEEFTS